MSSSSFTYQGQPPHLYPYAADSPERHLVEHFLNDNSIMGANGLPTGLVPKRPTFEPFSKQATEKQRHAQSWAPNMLYMTPRPPKHLMSVPCPSEFTLGTESLPAIHFSERSSVGIFVDDVLSGGVKLDFGGELVFDSVGFTSTKSRFCLFWPGYQHCFVEFTMLNEMQKSRSRSELAQEFCQAFALYRSRCSLSTVEKGYEKLDMLKSPYHVILVSLRYYESLLAWVPDFWVPAH